MVLARRRGSSRTSRRSKTDACIAEASGKTKRQVQELLARRFPRPDVASTIRRLPSPRARAPLPNLALPHSVPQPEGNAPNDASNEPRSRAQVVSSAQAASKSRAARKSRAFRAGVRAHVRNGVVRQIALRDGLRCTFVGSDGQRCAATRFTQIHHEEPWARGGSEKLDNLRILCAAHNRLLAEREFGRELIAKRIAKSRRGA